MRSVYGKTDYITAYNDNSCGRLEIRKRSDWKCTTIHDGCVYFRKDLELQVGDICLFECSIDSFRHFNVREIKSAKWELISCLVLCMFKFVLDILHWFIDICLNLWLMLLSFGYYWTILCFALHVLIMVLYFIEI